MEQKKAEALWEQEQLWRGYATSSKWPVGGSLHWRQKRPGEAKSKARTERQGRGGYERMVATTIKKWYRQGRPESGSWSKERRTEAGRGGDRRRGRHRAGALVYLEGRRTPKPRPLPGPTQPRSPAATKPQWRCPGFRREARGVTCRSQP